VEAEAAVRMTRVALEAAVKGRKRKKVNFWVGETRSELARVSATLQQVVRGSRVAI